MEPHEITEKKASWKLPRRSRRPKYRLDPIPRNRTVPEGEVRLEIREILWNDTLLSVLQCDHRGRISVGEHRRSTFRVFDDTLPFERLDILKPSSDGRYDLHFTKDLSGEVHANGKSENFHQLVSSGRAEEIREGLYRFALTREMSAIYDFGPVRLFVHLIQPEKRGKTPLSNRIDLPLASLSSILFMAYLIGILYLSTLPAPETADILDSPERLLSILARIEPEPEPPEPKKTPDIAPSSSEKSIGEEGRIGDAESVYDKAQGSARKRIEDDRVAVSSGILGALDRGSENLDRLFGGGGLGAGLDKFLGQLDGISGIDARGSGGLGSRGAGVGGGGMALGIGGLGTRGRGGNRDGRYGIGEAQRLTKKATVNLETPGPSALIGGLDKSIIARIIRKHHSQFRYCYQKELNKNARLYGKVSLRFVIGPAGMVESSTVQVSTLKNWNVEQCVSRTMKRLIFPRPRGGGRVFVTYPFIFNHKGE